MSWLVEAIGVNGRMNNMARGLGALPGAVNRRFVAFLAPVVLVCACLESETQPIAEIEVGGDSPSDTELLGESDAPSEEPEIWQRDEPDIGEDLSLHADSQGESDEGADEPETAIAFEFRLDVSHSSNTALVTIDGVATGHFEAVYDDYEAALENEVVVRAQFGNVILGEQPVSHACRSNIRGTPVKHTVALYVPANGEVRFAFSTCVTDRGSEHADGIGMAWCSVLLDSCPGGLRCSPVVVHEDPLFAQLNCIPDGSVRIGELCSRGETGRDDCARGGFCLDDRCREFCDRDRDCEGGESCVDITEDGRADNVRVCVAAD